MGVVFQFVALGPNKQRHLPETKAAFIRVISLSALWRISFAAELQVH